MQDSFGIRMLCTFKEANTTDIEQQRAWCFLSIDTHLQCFLKQMSKIFTVKKYFRTIWYWYKIVRKCRVFYRKFIQSELCWNLKTFPSKDQSVLGASFMAISTSRFWTNAVNSLNNLNILYLLFGRESCEGIDKMYTSMSLW